MINPSAIFKIKSAWETFTSNHPKFPAFLQAVSNGKIKEGTVIEISIITEDGSTTSTNVKLTQSDMELFEQLKSVK